ncbi:MAG: sigma-70 family RNA polymerase sigma factor [Planctomycetes bacterium]|nr:sigma-70 family RNA polymerase sigma factor [Planctomycetota bacterium]
MSKPANTSLPGRSDGELLADFVENRQESAFAEIMRRHGGMVLAACRSVLGSETEAEDATQAVFLTLAQKASSIKSQIVLVGWLHRVAWYVAARAVQANATRRRREQEAARMRTNSIHPNDEQVPIDILHAGLADLPEKYRVPLLLHYLEGRTQEETAAHMGCGVSAAAMRLNRGRQMLRERLAKRGAVVSAVTVAAVLGSQASAAVPAALVAATTKAATTILLGQAAYAVAISSKILALSKGALNMLFWAKMKVAAAVAAAVLLVGGAAGTYVTIAGSPQQGQAFTKTLAVAPQPDPQPDAPPSVNPQPQPATKQDPAPDIRPAETKPAAPTVNPQTLPVAVLADTGSLNGVVIDEDDKPVEGAGVEILEKVSSLDGIRWIKLGETKSEKDGSFKIVDLPAGKNIRLGAWLQMPNGPMVQGGKDLKVEAGKNTNAGKIKLQAARM